LRWVSYRIENINTKKIFYDYYITVTNEAEYFKLSLNDILQMPPKYADSILDDQYERNQKIREALENNK